MDLLTETKLLAGRLLTSRQDIERASAVIGCTTRWYDKVMRGDIRDPGVRRIQALHDYLTARKAA